MREKLQNKNKRVAVIGAGIFGCCVVLGAAKAGYDVVLFERLPDIMMGTSKNNTNRVHQGFHYPRNMQTAIECKENYSRFETEFREALLDYSTNIYCIAENKSLTSKEEFIKFCDALGALYSVIELENVGIKIDGCSLGISCQETILDSDILKNILYSKIIRNDQISLFCNTEVAEIKKISNQYELFFKLKAQSKQSFDAVVNCSYANMNTLTEQLGYEVQMGQYEYTVIPIINMDIPTTAITIMDGPFMTLFPYGQSKNFLLYHVDHSVIKTEITKTLDPDWLDPHKSPLSKIDQKEHFNKFLKSCSYFVPELKDAKLCGYLESPRLVLPKHENDDARPSFVNDYGEGYLSVFSGKIDRSLSIADSVCLKLDEYFNHTDSRLK